MGQLLQLTPGKLGWWENLVQQYCLKCSGAAGLQGPSFAGVVVSTLFKHCRHGPATPISQASTMVVEMWESWMRVLPYDEKVVIGQTLDMASSQAADGGCPGAAGEWAPTAAKGPQNPWYLHRQPTSILVKGSSEIQ